MTHTDLPGTRTDGLAGMIRAATWSDHGRAERVVFFDELSGGRLTPFEYAGLLTQMWPLYRALEDAGRALAGDPVAGPFVDERLLRVAAIEADLLVLLGDDWRDEVEVAAETQAYCDRIADVATWPAGFVAHHYTRYLGDLSGGLHIGRVVSRLYELTPDAGAAFYHFADIADPAAYKDRYRLRLDDLPIDAAEAEAMVDEVKAAYAHNTAVLEGLGSRIAAARGPRD